MSSTRFATELQHPDRAKGLQTGIFTRRRYPPDTSDGAASTTMSAPPLDRLRLPSIAYRNNGGGNVRTFQTTSTGLMRTTLTGGAGGLGLGVGLDHRSGIGNGASILSKNKDGHPCTVCGRTFSNPGALLRHSETHDKDMPFPCVICTRRFVSLAALSKHKIVHRAKDDFFRCRQCEERFLAAADFVQHKLQHQRAEHEQEVHSIQLARQVTETTNLKNKAGSGSRTKSAKVKHVANDVDVGPVTSGHDDVFVTPDGKCSHAGGDSIAVIVSIEEEARRKRRKKKVGAAAKGNKTRLEHGQEPGHGHSTGQIMFPDIVSRSSGIISVPDLHTDSQELREHSTIGDSREDHPNIDTETTTSHPHPLQQGPRRIESGRGRGTSTSTAYSETAMRTRGGGFVGRHEKTQTIWERSKPTNMRLARWEATNETRSRQGEQQSAQKQQRAQPRRLQPLSEARDPDASSPTPAPFQEGEEKHGQGEALPNLPDSPQQQQHQGRSGSTQQQQQQSLSRRKLRPRPWSSTRDDPLWTNSLPEQEESALEDTLWSNSQPTVVPMLEKSQAQLDEERRLRVEEERERRLLRGRIVNMDASTKDTESYARLTGAARDAGYSMKVSALLKELPRHSTCPYRDNSTDSLSWSPREWSDAKTMVEPARSAHADRRAAVWRLPSIKRRQEANGIEYLQNSSSRSQQNLLSDELRALVDVDAGISASAEVGESGTIEDAYNVAAAVTATAGLITANRASYKLTPDGGGGYGCRAGTGAGAGTTRPKKGASANDLMSTQLVARAPQTSSAGALDSTSTHHSNHSSHQEIAARPPRPPRVLGMGADKGRCDAPSTAAGAAAAAKADVHAEQSFLAEAAEENIGGWYGGGCSERKISVEDWVFTPDSPGCGGG